MNKKISALLAVKNGEKYLSETINSILQQTYDNFELIITINCSNDRTESIIKSFNDSRIKVLKSNICQLNYNLNLALSQAQGKYIARIDADDIALLDRFEKQIEVLENSDYSVVGSNIIYINEKGEIIGEKKYPEKNQQIRRQILYKAVLAHPTILCKREDLLNVGGYMGGKYAQDYDLWLRMMRNEKIKFYNIQKPLLYYRIHSSQTKGNKLSYADVAGYMLRESIYQKNLKFFLGSMVYYAKAILR